tara:strand:+ start:282 stop:1208 length:927 start_codon:yes stop_codon:yes gene_type:complete
MLLQKFFIFFIFIFCSNVTYSNEKVYIAVTVDDQIITNIDIEKEANYLVILNPNLIKIDKNKIFDLAKKNLIDENIKKKEIKKFFSDQNENNVGEKFFENLLKRIKISQSEFEQILFDRKSYSLTEIKMKLDTEIFWNDLIYLKFNNQIDIDRNELLKKVNNMKNQKKKEYLLSEIIFEKKINQNLNDLIVKIQNSISGVGFNNTANIYSISESAKFGGKIGWVAENNLSDLIIDKIKDKKKNQYTDIIEIGNNYMILLIEEIRFTETEIDKDVELRKMIEFERNKLLNKFSKIYFNKTKINYSINEK